MFVGLSEISRSVAVLKCETCWNYQGNLISFPVPRGCKKLLGCGLLGGAVPSLTLWILNLKKVILKDTLKGAPKLFFMDYLWMVIMLFNAGLYKSLFSTYFFGKLVFCCLFCFEFDVILVDFLIGILIKFVESLLI